MGLAYGYLCAMAMNDAECYRALQARDARFDGSFFVCVESTGIYCRPVCPARTPRRDRCRFVRTAAAAAAAGFRPCLRCRPETAPGSPAWLGSQSTVGRAIALLQGADDSAESVDAIAQRLGISVRQLHRLFTSHLGATPIAVAQTARLAIARQLLLRSTCSMTDVALAAGFRSVRRFNSALKAAFGSTPMEMRRAHGGTASAEGLRLALAYRPPYAWSDMLEYFRIRAVDGLEQVDDGYTRTVRIGSAVGTLRVSHEARQHRLVAEFQLDRPAHLVQAAARVRDLFDLDAHPQRIAEHLALDARLRALVERDPGIRIPGCWDVFETVVRAIVGQQVSVQAATTVLGRLVQAYGEPLPASMTATRDWRLFPQPRDLCDADLRKLGLNRARAETIQRIARLFDEDPAFIHTGMSDEEADARLRGVRGIGPWTANYVRLRALRNPDAFPDADLGALKATGATSARELAAMATAWRPWRGYALLYLWKSLNA
jgi:AraC family transcriptional regulator of adaptative response / DNA-3-methyladenine glycosylase II